MPVNKTVYWRRMHVAFKAVCIVVLASVSAVCFTGNAMAESAPMSTITITQIPIEEAFRALSPDDDMIVNALVVLESDLHFGSKGPEVLALQKFLNSKDFKLAATGVGSPGNETEYFGPLTMSSLVKRQKSIGISPANGYFGKITKAYIKNINY